MEHDLKAEDDEEPRHPERPEGGVEQWVGDAVDRDRHGRLLPDQGRGSDRQRSNRERDLSETLALARGHLGELVRRPGQLLVEVRDLLALHDREHHRDPEREVDADHEGGTQAAHDHLQQVLPAEVARAHRRDGDDRHDDGQQQGQQPLPVREVARPDEEQGLVRVLRGEPLGIAELRDGGALGLGGDHAGGDPGLHRIGDERPDLGSKVGALGRGDGPQDAPDIAIGKGAHDSRPPWPSRRTDASIRSQSARSSAARRSPSGLIR